MTVAVYRPKSVPRDEWDGVGVLDGVAGALARVFGGKRLDNLDAWRSRVLLREPLPPAVVARGIGRVRSTPLQGGRVHYGVQLRSGEWAPISNGFESVRDATTMAMDQLLLNLGKYGAALTREPLYEVRRCQARRGGRATGAQCRRVESHPGKHRYTGRPEELPQYVREDDDDA